MQNKSFNLKQFNLENNKIQKYSEFDYNILLDKYKIKLLNSLK